MRACAEEITVIFISLYIGLRPLDVLLHYFVRKVHKKFFYIYVNILIRYIQSIRKDLHLTYLILQSISNNSDR